MGNHAVHPLIHPPTDSYDGHEDSNWEEMSGHIDWYINRWNKNYDNLVLEFTYDRCSIMRSWSAFSEVPEVYLARLRAGPYSDCLPSAP